MAELIKESMNIEEVKFHIKLSKLNEFRQYESGVFGVRGNAWTMQFNKRKNTANQDTLAIYLNSTINNNVANWSVVASFTIEILSNKFNGTPYKAHFEPHAYNWRTLSLGNPSIITWNELMDADKGYVQNNECTIVFKVKASPVYNEMNNQTLEFATIPKCCNVSLTGGFRLKINKFRHFEDVSTPIFELGDSSWRFLVCKKQTTADDVFEIKLHNLKFILGGVAPPCNIIATCKLLSFNLNAVPIQNRIQTRLNPNNSIATLTSFSWNELVDPLKEIVRNDSFTLCVELKIGTANESCACGDSAAAVKLVCSICMGDLAAIPTSTAGCGHMFCSV